MQETLQNWGSVLKRKVADICMGHAEGSIAPSDACRGYALYAAAILLNRQAQERKQQPLRQFMNISSRQFHACLFRMWPSPRSKQKKMKKKNYQRLCRDQNCMSCLSLVYFVQTDQSIIPQRYELVTGLQDNDCAAPGDHGLHVLKERALLPSMLQRQT